MTEGDAAVPVLPIREKSNGTSTLSQLRRVIICAGSDDFQKARLEICKVDADRCVAKTNLYDGVSK